MKKIISILLIFLLISSLIILKHNILHDKSLGKKDDSEDIVIIDDEGQKKDEHFSPLSGIYAPLDKVDRRPVAVMFDNHPKARWQAGLSQAEIVYEISVEYPYTRYMGIFLINEPKELGPIRSSRPYFVTALFEYDPIYVRAGGSEKAKEDIKRLNVADIDALTNAQDVFFRNTKVGKKSPHNLYTSMEDIRKGQEEKGYHLSGIYDEFKFYEEDTEIKGTSARQIEIIYNKQNSTSYTYDKNEGIYKRYKDGKLHVDEYYDVPIQAKNIIIQQVNTKTIDNEGRLEIDMLGSGSGLYITNGRAKKINWTKNSIEEKTKYYDEDGDEILLNSGFTWIQIVNEKSDIKIK